MDGIIVDFSDEDESVDNERVESLNDNTAEPNRVDVQTPINTGNISDINSSQRTLLQTVVPEHTLQDVSFGTICDHCDGALDLSNFESANNQKGDDFKYSEKKPGSN